MEKVELKKRLLEECIRIQTNHLQNLKEEIDEAERIANDHDGGAEENMDSFREEMQNKREVFSRQFQITNTDLQILRRVDAGRTESSVQFGSVVITDNQKLFVTVSLGKINLEGQDYFAISMQTPLFKVLTGKKKGETASFNGREIKIVDVF
jgi:transcription elongation GreA/GreB family factor